MAASSRNRPRRLLPSAVALLLAGLALTACGSDDKPAASGRPSAAANASLSKEVPDSFKGRELTVATEANYPPMEYIDTDGKTIVGLEPDLVEAMGQVLGLDLKMVNTSFDSIIPGLSSGKYDLAISSMNATPEREQVVTMVSVRTGGSSFVVRAADASRIQTLDDLCGLKVAVQSGSTQADDVQKQASKCTAAGKPAPKALSFADENGMYLALSSERADVLVGGGPGNAWKVKQSGGKFAVAGEAYGVETTAMGFPKDSPLAKPMCDALNELIADGTYAKILAKWGENVDGIALPKSVVNPA